MIKHLLKLRQFFIHVKVYISRTAGYISLVNTGMILFLFLSNLEKYKIDIDIQDWLIPIFVLGVSLMIIFGYIEDKMGFYREEIKTRDSRSALYREINERLKRIEEKLK